METPKVNFTKFNPANLQKTAPVQKQSAPKPVDPNNPDGEKKPITYYNIPFQYKYTVLDKSGKERSVISDLYIEGPEISCGGILTKGNSASVFATFDMKDPDIRQFVNYPSDDTHDDEMTEEQREQAKTSTMSEIYEHTLNTCWDNRGAVGLKITKKEFMPGVVSFPIYYKRDDITSQPIRGRNPSKYFGLLNFGKPGSYNRRETIFTAVDDTIEEGYRIMPWDELKNVEMRIIPLIHVGKIYVGGGKASIQMTIVSAVIKDIVPAGSISNQKDTIAEIRKDTVLVNHLKKQLETLKLVRSKPAPKALSEGATVDNKRNDSDRKSPFSSEDDDTKEYEASSEGGTTSARNTSAQKPAKKQPIMKGLGNLKIADVLKGGPTMASKAESADESEEETSAASYASSSHASVGGTSHASVGGNASKATPFKQRFSKGYGKSESEIEALP